MQKKQNNSIIYSGNYFNLNYVWFQTKRTKKAIKTFMHKRFTNSIMEIHLNETSIIYSYVIIRIACDENDSIMLKLTYNLT